MSLRARMGSLWLAAALVTIAGCAAKPAPPKLFVDTRHEDDVAFDRYSTYAWVTDQREWVNPVFLEFPELPGLIGAAVDRELAARGFEKSLAADADFLVAMSASVQDVTVISKHRYAGWSHGYDRTALPGTATATRLDKMPEGTLILEVVDVASEGVVWQSRAAGVVTRRENLEQAVDAAVTRMLERFPPPS